MQENVKDQNIFMDSSKLLSFEVRSATEACNKTFSLYVAHFSGKNLKYGLMTSRWLKSKIIRIHGSDTGPPRQVVLVAHLLAPNFS